MAAFGWSDSNSVEATRFVVKIADQRAWLASSLMRAMRSDVQPTESVKFVLVGEQETMEIPDELFYSYYPLDPLAAEIRLLQITSISEDTDAIQCTLSHECLLPYGSTVSSSAIPVFSRPLYNALSYVWGDANKDGEVFIEGRRLRISSNLDEAIRYLHADGHLQMRIWIDAICVNQDDIAERSSQVLLMRRLYYNAQSVIIWLGAYPGISGLDKSFDLIEDLVEGAVDTEIDPWDDDTNEIWEPTAHALVRFEEKLGDESILWAAQMISEDLFRRHAWWDRMWVVQELALSANATVHREHRHVQWRDIVRVSKWIESQHERIFSGGYLTPVLNLGQIRSRWARGESLSLQGLMAACGQNSCTDPRDNVYALLGIVTEDFNLLNDIVRPDYSAPVCQVFATAIVFTIASRKSLNSICSAYHWTPTEIDLPSWAPDLKTRLDATPQALLQQGNNKQIWNASGTMTSLINWEGTSSTCQSLPYLRPFADEKLWLKILHTSCILIDTISEVSDLALRPFAKAGSLEPWERIMRSRFGNPYSTKWSFSMQDVLPIFNRYRALVRGERPLPEFRSTIHELSASQPRPDQRYVGGGTVLEAWIRTILVDQVQEYKRATEAEITAFCRCRCPPDFLQHLNLDIKHRVERFMALLFHACLNGTRGKRLIITEKEYIGSVPVEARQGDLLCVLIGCDVPVVLRRKGGQDDSRYILVCEAYVHGLMDGEAVKMLNNGVLNVQNIILE